MRRTDQRMVVVVVVVAYLKKFNLSETLYYWYYSYDRIVVGFSQSSSTHANKGHKKEEREGSQSTSLLRMTALFLSTCETCTIIPTGMPFDEI